LGAFLDSAAHLGRDPDSQDLEICRECVAVVTTFPIMATAREIVLASKVEGRREMAVT